MGFRRLEVEGDALSVLKNIRSREVGKSIIRPIIFHIQQLKRKFEAVTFTFVPRKVNEATDALAIEGRRKEVGQIWTNVIPKLVQTVVRKDRIAWKSRF
ncbi:hypothetical protein Gohar_015308, partial [Gossypium harknessii]|nr:hypothetical protein [Gossypium harknessii]